MPEQKGPGLSGEERGTNVEQFRPPATRQGGEEGELRVKPRETRAMKESIKTGLSFGMTSGVITTLGLMVGLHAGTRSALAVIGGILTIAVADGLSDALGIHISKEAENTFTTRQIWIATITTFVAKFVIACTFIVPVLLLDLVPAIFASIAWGLALLIVLSYRLARSQGNRPLAVIGEHLLIAVLVIVITHELGDWVGRTFQ